MLRKNPSGHTPVVSTKAYIAVSYTHLRAHETKANLVCRLLLEKKKKTYWKQVYYTT